jgi:hypothetical protein
MVSHDPFSYRPRVTVIPLPPSSTTAQLQQSSSSSIPVDQPQPGGDELKDDPSGRVWTYHFDHPARFPRTEFGAACCAFEGEGAVIHEGMRLLARQDGQYEVRFNITTPSMPVMLRLQLILFEQGRPYATEGRPIPRTLTLAPIPLRPWDADPYPDMSQAGVDPSKAGVAPVSYLVRVRGYSQVIKEAQRGDGRLLLVRRIGTARFGSGVQIQANQ